MLICKCTVKNEGNLGECLFSVLPPYRKEFAPLKRSKFFAKRLVSIINHSGK